MLIPPRHPHVFVDPTVPNKYPHNILSDDDGIYIICNARSFSEQTYLRTAPHFQDDLFMVVGHKQDNGWMIVEPVTRARAVELGIISGDSKTFWTYHFTI